MDLNECRKEIDEIDRQLVDLYEKRMAVTEEVAQYKIETGKPVLDRDREKRKLAAVSAMAKNDFTRYGVRELFEQIMATSRKRQYQIMAQTGALYRLPFIEVEHISRPGIRVVYQGAAGSYSEAAMKKFFGDGVDNFAVETFRDAMTAIEEGAADYAVLPIENSTAGVVSQIYDLLVEFENYIVGEQIIPIEHCLMGCEGCTEETIERVYSHPQSLMQSEKFLSEHPWEQIGMKNNAFAAQKVAADQDPSEAAIASEYAAKMYGLHILKKGVNTTDKNSTRFIVITNQKIFRKDATKVSIVMEVPHESGSLYHLLSHFIFNGLNMNMIESRPIEDRPWEYRFFIDFDGNLKEPGVRNALRGLRDEARNLRILGNYRS